MAEYIDRLDAYLAIGKKAKRGRNAFNDGLAAAIDAIGAMPAADVTPRCPHYIRNVHDRGDDSLCEKWVCEVKDVAPVRHGRWVNAELDEPVDWFRCSVCGHDAPWNAPYCEMCGAKMDGGET